MSSYDRMQDYLAAIKNAATWNKRTPIEQAESDRAAAGAFPGGPTLKPGDWVLHPESGRCHVHKIDDPVVHLVSDGGRTIELSLETTVFAPHSIEKGNLRVFSMSPNALF